MGRVLFLILLLFSLRTVKITWDHSPEPDVAGYWVWIGEDYDQLERFCYVDYNFQSKGEAVLKLPEKVLYLGLTAVDGSGNESVMSEIIKIPKFGDFDLDGDRDGKDLAKFLNFYEVRDSRADLNEDGMVDKQDLEIFCKHWGL